jgi:hypothetical protein
MRGAPDQTGLGRLQPRGRPPLSFARDGRHQVHQLSRAASRDASMKNLSTSVLRMRLGPGWKSLGNTSSAAPLHLATGWGLRAQGAHSRPNDLRRAGRLSHCDSFHLNDDVV